MQAALEMLAGPAPEPGAADLDAWLARLAELDGQHASPPSRRPIDRAMAGGFAADRLGYAFAAGYKAALDALLGERSVAALCVTEAGGNHPRAIETRLEGAALTGTKTFVTLGERAEVLWVAATAGPGEDGRPQIRLVRIERDSPGVRLEPAPAIAVVPEIPHARAILDGVEVADQRGLREDGYPAIKAFRTVEDIHVHAAAVAYLIGAARRAGGLDPAAIESLLATAAALWALAAAPPLAASTHLALAGVIDGVEPPGAEWSWPSDDERDRWLRDRPLLSVAGRARESRRARAREILAV